jgi:hypothetical protein
LWSSVTIRYMSVNTIDEVIASLDAIIQQAWEQQSRIGYFAALYLRVTHAVRDGLNSGSFQNGPLMEHLDVVFASRYLDALATYQAEGAPSRSWKLAFDACSDNSRLILQHLLAGMNAHINRDLALALLAADAGVNVVPAADSPEHGDYEAVNGLLNSVMPAALTMLATDTLGVLAEDTGKIGRVLAFWDICQARELAWDFAGQLRGLPELSREAALYSQDTMTGALGRAILAVV